MSTGESRIQISEQILEEACDWFIDFNEGDLDASGCEHFNRWLQRSPEHVRAYVEIAAAWEDSSKLRGAQQFDTTSLIAAALAGSNVLPLNRKVSEPSASATAPAKTTRLPSLVFAGAASALLAIGIGFLVQRNAYTTNTGEQRSIVLDDGSTVNLNARSSLRVRFSHTERLVDLITGQALFSVRNDAARPFIVLSNGTRVRAVGTQFDVYRKPAGTTVTVVEGQVAVTEVLAPTPASSAYNGEGGGGKTGAPILLSAGEQLTVAAQTVPHAVRVDPAAAIAWTQRKLVFEETPLSEVVAEFNRYNSRQMIIEDASLSEYHIRGHFEAGDPDRLIQFLRDRFDADVREHGNEIRISRK
jgi:transmembrane sensor